MRTIFMRNSRRLCVLFTSLFCLLFIYFLRMYKENVTSKTFDQWSPSEGMLGTLNCESFTSSQILITTPRKIILYDWKTDQERTVHAGQGLYYGSFKGSNLIDPLTKKCSPQLIVNTRPQDMRGNDRETGDKIIRIDMTSGMVIEKHELPFSSFTHDMIKYKEHVYVADTAHGIVWQLSLPTYEISSKIDAFKPKDHVNNLAVKDGLLFAMLHSRGVSGVGVVDLRSKEAIIIRGIGSQAHQTVLIGKFQLVYLDSGDVSLKVLNFQTMKVHKLLKLEETPKKFLKGLYVKDSVAYIGVTVAGSRQWRRDPDNDADILAFDLRTYQILWRRKLSTDGLANMITQPFISESSGYWAIQTDELEPPDSMLCNDIPVEVEQRQVGEDGSSGVVLRKLKSSGGIQVVDEASEILEKENMNDQPGKDSKEARVPIVSGPVKSGKIKFYNNGDVTMSEVTPETLVGGEWPSGLKFIDLRWKAQGSNLDLTNKVDRASDAQLIMGQLSEDIYGPLKKMLLDLPKEMWEYKNQVGNAFLSERDDVMNRFKPGVRDIKFTFSDISAQNSFWFPWYFKFEKVLTPIIDHVLGANMTNHIARMQLARMSDGAQIKPHIDSGGWPSALHRIHVPLIVPSETQFHVVGKHGQANSYLIHLQEGEVFEINNRVQHWVKNPSDQRIHLLIDARERPYEPHWLAPGQVCKYLRDIICEEETTTKEDAYKQYLSVVKESI